MTRNKKEQFTLTEEHLLLLQRMYVEFEDGGYSGAPAVNLKRPYGNSDVVNDLVEVLGLQDTARYNRNGELDETTEKRLLKLHQQTATALQICLCTRSFNVGIYQKEDLYCDRSWAYWGPLPTKKS